MSYGFFLPIKVKGHGELSNTVQINTPSFFMTDTEALMKKNGVFFKILSDNSTVGMFINAIAHYEDGEDPYAFMSKTFAGELDLKTLKNVFDSTGNYKCLLKAEFKSVPGNCMTHSVVVFNEERKINSIIHLHMVNEPDRFGKWKIFGIERE